MFAVSKERTQNYIRPKIKSKNPVDWKPVKAYPFNQGMSTFCTHIPPESPHSSTVRAAARRRKYGFRRGSRDGPLTQYLAVP